MAIPKKVVTDKMDTSEEEGAGDNIDSKDTSEQQECSYVNLGSKGPGKPIQIRTTGTQNVNEQSASASSIVRNPAVPLLDALVLGTSTEKFADNIVSVTHDTDYPSKHIPAVDPPRGQTCLTSILQPGYNDPCSSNQNQTQKSPPTTTYKTTPRKRKKSQDRDEQHSPTTKVARFENNKDIPLQQNFIGGVLFFKVGNNLIPIQLLRPPPPASLTQTYSPMLLQQQQQQPQQPQQQLQQLGNIDRPPDNEPLDLCTRQLSPLNLSSRPLDLSLNKQAPDRQMVIGEPALLSNERDQQPINCTVAPESEGLASVIGPQYTEGPENTVGQVVDVSLEEKDEDQSDDVNVPGNLPDLGTLTLNNKKSSNEKKKDAATVTTAVDQQANEANNRGSRTDQGEGEADQGSSENNDGASGSSSVPNFDTLQVKTVDTPRDILLSNLKERLRRNRNNN